MGSPWFNDENFDGFSGDFLDTIKFLDFPLEDVEENQVEGWDAEFEHLGSLPSDVLDDFSSGFVENRSDAPKVQSGNSLFDEKSLKKPPPSSVKSTSGRSILHESETSDGKCSLLFHTSSPVSVLESSKPCSTEHRLALDPKIVFPLKRARSKRWRSFSFNPWLAASFTYPAAKCLSLSSSQPISEPGDLPEPQLPKNPVERKQKEKNLSILSGAGGSKKCPSLQALATRKCMHCEVTKTPQWREGPVGPKTLCNACGVRYRTGRLFPEYRPAASPTFVPSVHSNSHKKVVEMRKKGKTWGQFGCKGPLA